MVSDFKFQQTVTQSLSIYLYYIPLNTEKQVTVSHK